MNGINFEGTDSRPLERCKISLLLDGSIKFEKTKNFRQEESAWENPDSFLQVT